MIKPISNITLKPLPKSKRGKISSLVEVDGVCYDEKLEGRYLEMAFSYDDCYVLIFVPHDSYPNCLKVRPAEESAFPER
ncbi:hypothetical protein [Gilliamella sp. Nev3-1]|jgi:hypothetical protein|uniref:hypothetical protein n=1 Tax=Gilliamella sp. Nev3-1 TaxID=3120250 RepID=UPI00080E04C9|nr:hypothetical protein [Gilliamella apicola]OCG59373.1 hypothetical protein A9G40_07340 [Gilliamella apicola]